LQNIQILILISPIMADANKNTRKQCIVTGKKAHRGGKINRKGQSKKSGGIGTHVTKHVARTFKPNLQRKRIKLENGSIINAWVSAKALKAGLVELA